MRLARLYVYPVKSLRGFAVTDAQADACGLEGDRRFLVVDATGRFLTQRTLPRMALIDTRLRTDALILSAGGRQIEVQRGADPAAPLRSVSVWQSHGLLAEDCGDDVARWLGSFLEVPCRLVRMGPKFIRPVLKPDIAGPGDVVSFADSCPFLLVSEASVDDLNDRLTAQGEERVPMDRFRPNLVVTGCRAYAEDSWTRFRVGEMTFHHAGPCTRCAITTTDQRTAERGREPLRTLASYRRDPRDSSDVIFGANIIHETKTGTLRVGDAVTLFR